MYVGIIICPNWQVTFVCLSLIKIKQLTFWPNNPNTQCIPRFILGTHLWPYNPKNWLLCPSKQVAHYSRNPKSKFLSRFQGCPTVALSHQRATGVWKLATNQKNKALFNWEISQDMKNWDYHIFHVNYFWYKLYLKNSDLYLVILTIDW